MITEPKQQVKITTHTDRPDAKKKASPIKQYLCNELFQKCICRSLFLEHRPHCRVLEPLRYVALKSTSLLILVQTTEHFTEARYEYFTSFTQRNLYFQWHRLEDVSATNCSLKVQWFFLVRGVSKAAQGASIEMTGMQGDRQLWHPIPIISTTSQRIMLTQGGHVTSIRHSPRGSS